MPKPGKGLEQKQVDQHFEALASTASLKILDEAFGKWDNIKDEDKKLPVLDRADHIVINGRTGTELLMERFNQEFPNMKKEGPQPGTFVPYESFERARGYNDFYEANGKKYLNEIVTAALNDGAEVEVFVPDSTTGEISDTPARLTAQGFDFKHKVSKPTMNAWQSFWSKFGFYKKELEAVNQY